WDRLYRWLYHLTHDRHAAEDLAQDVFLKALAHLDSFRPGTNFRAWLFRIAHNAFVNHTRAAARQRRPVSEEFADRDPGPPELAEERESLQRLGRAVAQLPAEFRAAFLLRAEEGLSFRDTARALGLPEETARWRAFKARKKLLSVLNPERDGEKP